ncbi:MAG: hypothetical protein J6Z38_06090 [Lachnospiraceae bacterium]|nr:hypothetical protein [Lachnospiraceae bacterium]
MKAPYVHFSIDDFFDTLEDLDSGRYTDIFEQPVLRFLKELHGRYGCTFSGYCFFRKEEDDPRQPGGKRFRTLEEFAFPEALQAQFKENAGWLKLGFHALDHGTAYGPTHFSTQEVRASYDQAQEDCRKTHEALARLCGGEEVLDLVPRIHYFAGTADALRAWKDLGIRGLLSADDDRIPYDLTEEEVRKLKEDFLLEDGERGLFLIRTALRLEKTEDPEAAWKDLRAAGKPYIEIFTHEYFMDRPDIREKFETFARLLQKDGPAFGFA